MLKHRKISLSQQMQFPCGRVQWRIRNTNFKLGAPVQLQTSKVFSYRSGSNIQNLMAPAPKMIWSIEN